MDLATWNQTADDLREAALTATHTHTRERFFARASTAARGAFVERLQEILQRTLGPEAPLMIDLDEAHIHQDADLGYG